MKRSFFLSLFIVFFCNIVYSQNEAAEPLGKNNIAYKWGDICLSCTANDTERFRPRPTVTSRYLGLIWTAVFDAWSRYNKKAIPVYLTNINRRPAQEQTLKNKEVAVSYAAYRTMMEYYVSDSVMLTQTMIQMGYDPQNYTLDPSSPIGIGNLAANAVIEGRYNDGANQKGDRQGSNGKPYSDYSEYKPINSVDTVVELNRWQPKFFSDGKGGQFAPSCLTPQWGKVDPLMLDSASQFRPVPPPKIGSQKLANELAEVVYLQAHLTNQQKALVEFMRDGPKSVQQAGHWFIFAQNVSVRDNHTLDEDVKMYFLTEATAMDAFIACWEAKMFYDYARPYTLIHDFFKNQQIEMWGGADKGMIKAKGQEWRPYSPETFLCPPFPSYVSGHSTISAACAESLRLFTGSDRFGVEVKRLPGIYTEGKAVGDSVTLEFPTFTQTAEMAGFSRVLGGYHIASDNGEGLKLGRNVASAVWKKYKCHTGISK